MVLLKYLKPVSCILSLKPVSIVVDEEQLSPNSMLMKHLVAYNAPLPLTFAEEGMEKRLFSAVRPGIASPPLVIPDKSDIEYDFMLQS